MPCPPASWQRSREPPYSPAVTDPAVLEELRKLRASLDALVAENADLCRRLEHSEAARADLLAQAEHLLDLLAKARAK